MMFRSSAYSRLLKSITLIMLFTGITTAQTIAPSGAERPANVPEDYVITPAGYFHPSCIAHLAEGDLLRKEEKVIQHADGSIDSIPVCAYAHFTAKGKQIETNDEKVEAEARSVEEPSISHAWIEYVSTTTSSSFGELGADWNVPAAPTTNDGQIVFLFTGLEDHSEAGTILQPVLGWNSDFASAWGIASWNCCVSGTVSEATPQRVNVGDKIAGYMWDDCASGTLRCTAWDVLTYDLTTGKYSELMSTPSFKQIFNWASAGALEVYNISQCSDYPAAGSFQFYDLELYNNSFVEYSNPGWTFTNESAGLTPQCSYGATVSAAQVTLTY